MADFEPADPERMTEKSGDAKTILMNQLEEAFQLHPTNQLNLPSTKERSKRNGPAGFPRARSIAANPPALLRALLNLADHVIDRLLHEVVRPGDLSTFRRHDAGLAVEAFDRMLVESVLALGDAWTP